MMDCTPIKGLQRRKLPAALLCALTLLLGALLSARPALAQDFAAAGQHFSSAQDAFAQGKFELAASEFQAAYDITKDPSMLLNIGESWQRAGNGKKAVEGYKAYLAAQPQASDRAQIESRIRAIESGSEPPSGAEKPKDGAAPDKAPDSGATPGTASTPEKPATATSTSPGKPAEEKAPADVSGATGLTTPKVVRSGMYRAAWVGVAVTVALSTAGAIVGMGAQHRADELRRRTTILVGNQPPVYDAGQADAYTTLVTEGNAYNQASIALLSVAGAMAVTTAILFLVDHARHNKEKEQAKPKSALRLLPAVGPGPGLATVGLAARGSF